MKMTLFCLALIFTTSSLHASPNRTNPLLHFLASIAGVKELALYTLMENRCHRYVKRDERAACDDAIDRQLSVLDFDLLFGPDKTPVKIDQSFVFLAFKKDLLRLMKEEKTQIYLQDVNQQIQAYLAGEKSQLPNLWTLTLTHFPDKVSAAGALAALFQDISPARLHLAYLQKTVTNRGERFDANFEMLMRTLDSVTMVLDLRPDAFATLFYPAELKAKLNPAIYHFYVPLYLALRLEKAGVKKRYAAMAPLMMSLTYEFITAAPDERYFFADPARLDRNSKTDQYKLRDIYGSHNGTLMAMGLSDKVVAWDELTLSFDTSTASGVAKLLNY